MALHPNACWGWEPDAGGSGGGREEGHCNSFKADMAVKGKYFKG